MQTTIPADDILPYVARQCEMLLPDGAHELGGSSASAALTDALDRCDECFRHITLRGYTNAKGEAQLSHLHSDQWTQFLYFLANSPYQRGCEDAARKVSFLGRALSSCFISYKCTLPNHFLLGHPMGSVIGNADYGDCLVVFQNVTINSGADGTDILLPHIGRGLFMAAGSAIIGTHPVGNRVSVGVNAIVYNVDLPDDSVFDAPVGVRQRYKDECKAQQFFDIDL